MNRVKLRFRMIAALLLLVNGLCTAAPVLQAFVDSEDTTAAILFSSVNTVHAEEEQVLTSVYAVKSHNKSGKLISSLPVSFCPGNHLDTCSKVANHYISYSNLLTIPDYYSFLSLFYLF